jgi:hypothetical protein
MEEPKDLYALDGTTSQQLLGWVYATLKAGQVVDAAEWNRAVTTLTSKVAV